MLQIRKANDSDFERITEIYKIAQDFMIASGNPNQWGHFNPTTKMIKSDINNNVCHVIYLANGSPRIAYHLETKKD